MSKIIVGVQGDLHCIGDGKLYLRIKDYGYMSGKKFNWQEVEITSV